MKKVALMICSVVLFSLIAPHFSKEVAAEKADLENGEIMLIKDTADKAIYQQNVDGELLEYQETITVNKNRTKVKVKVYKVEGKKKKLIDNYKSTIIEEGDAVLTVENDEGQSTTIDLKKEEEAETPSFSTLAYYSTGGSYIADTRYRIYSDGRATAIMNGMSPYYKYTYKNNPNFIRFKGHADSLRSKEWGLISFGVVTVADNLIAAIRGGQALTWTLVKKLAGSVLRVGIVSAAYSLFSYGYEWYKARYDYRRI
ncbi:hypothetical protein [Bacillus marinisedimentorum]|uniref:hypothetical protein n=1 Tax=Bacillus marinisedimentorum TaxID=1821260 RepID=UPI0007E2A236|nr:hypothetical protein [Bacillus marinisedimentorum]